MSKYQYPILTDEKEFEELINDLCKKVFDLNSFQLYGRRGQKQDGIDGIALNKKRSLITFQCKNKLQNRTDKKIQDELLSDIVNEAEKVKKEFIDKKSYIIEYFVFANSFKQDKKLQNKALELSSKYGFKVIIWSWDEIQNYLEKNLDIAKFYYPYFFDKSLLSIDDIKRKLQNNSKVLMASSNYYIDKAFISMPEYDAISSFINQSTKDNILVVTGKAGIGKTALLSKVQKKCEDNKLTCLSIKADRIVIENKQSLSEIFEVDNLLNSIRQISLNEKVVIVIDQLDALSLTISSDRTSINIILEFIEQLKGMFNTKVVVSLREYDLKNDPLLSYLENDRVLYLKPFSKEFVKLKMSSLVKYNNKVSESLVELLRIPLNLSLFLELYSEDDDLTIKTLQDLYKKFWQKKIQDKLIDKNLRLNSIKFLELLVERMTNLKRIEVPILYFEDDYDDEISLLLSKGVIVKEDEKISFFHQTFYDFIFAKNFVKNEKSLFDFIISIEQNLEIREQIKQILEFLRGTNPKQFLVEVDKFLSSAKIRLHVKLLIISYFGNLERPTKEEYLFLKKLFVFNKSYEKYFIESWISSDWIKFFKKDGFFIEESFNKYNLNYKLEVFINKESDLVFSILDHITYNEKLVEQTMIECLVRLEKWTDNSVEILEKYENAFFTGKDYRYDRKKIFRKLFEYDKSKAEKLFIKLLNQELLDLQSLDKREILCHETLEIFEKVFNYDSQELYIGILEFFENISKNRTRKYSKKEYVIEDDIFYSSTMFQFESKHHTIWDLYRQILNRLSNLAKINKSLFLEIMNRFNLSKYMSILNFKIFAYSEDIKSYKNEIYELITDEKLFNEMNFHWENGYKLLKLINKAYPFYSEKEKIKVLSTITSVLPSWEKRRWKKETTSYGLNQYRLLLQIPLDEIKKFNYYKKYQELQRKFSWFIEEEPKVSKCTWVGNPLPSVAYEKMSLKNWLQSMLVFGEINERDNSFLRGDKTEHSREFEKQISQNIGKFYNFLFEIKDNNVHPDYLSSALSALISSDISNEKLFDVIQYYSNVKNPYTQRQLIKGMNKLLKNDYFNESFVDILEQNKDIKYEGITREKDKFQSIYDNKTSAINSYQGDLSSILPLILKKKFDEPLIKQRVLNLIYELIDKEIYFVYFELLDSLSYVSHVDKKLYSKLVCKLIEKDKFGQLSLYSLKIIHYLYQNDLIIKHKFLEVIEKSISFVALCKNKEDAHSINYLGMLLFFYFVNDEIDEQLLSRAINTNSQVIFGVLSQAFSRELLSNNEKVLKLAKQYILKFKNDEKNGFYYSHELENFEKLDLIKNDFEFLKELAKSMNIKRESTRFVKYLRNEYYKNTSIVKKILELLEINIKSIIEKNKVQSYHHGNTELIEFIIELYSRMKLEHERSEILDLLDTFLENDSLRYSTKNLIE